MQVFPPYTAKAPAGAVPPIQMLRSPYPRVSYEEARQIVAAHNARLPTLLEWGLALRSSRYHEIMRALPGASGTNAAIPAWGDCLLKSGPIADLSDSYFPNHVLLAEDVRKAAQKGDLQDPGQSLGIVYTVASTESWKDRIIYHPSGIFVQEVARNKGGKFNAQTGLAQPISDEEFDSLGWAEQAWYFGPDNLVNRPLAAGNFFFDKFCWFRLADGGRLEKGFGVGGVPLSGVLPKAAAKEEEASPAAPVPSVAAAPSGAIQLTVSAEGDSLVFRGLPPALSGPILAAATKGCELANRLLRTGQIEDLRSRIEAFLAIQLDLPENPGKKD